MTKKGLIRIIRETRPELVEGFVVQIPIILYYP